jgi:hypothetical protein
MWLVEQGRLLIWRFRDIRFWIWRWFFLGWWPGCEMGGSIRFNTWPDYIKGFLNREIKSCKCFLTVNNLVMGVMVVVVVASEWQVKKRDGDTHEFRASGT